MERAYHPGIGSVVSYRAEEIPEDPDGQVAATIGRMAEHVRQDLRSPEIGRDAAEVEDTARRSGVPVHEALFRYVKDRLSFRTDAELAAPFRVPDWSPIVEVLVPPRDLSIFASQGARPPVDCDDFSMYTAALGARLGFMPRFVTVAADWHEPDRWSHVYAVLYTADGTRIPMDTSHGPRAGWEADGPGIQRRHEWRIVEPELWHTAVMIGLGVAGLWAANGGRLW